ncbi:MAG: phosphoribosyltransferase family protein [Christensenellales bacterium]|jgi:adenine phosphoribosyltransferase
MAEFYTVNIKGRDVDLPVIRISNDIKIAFFNLHGAQDLTEFCAKEMAKLVEGAEVVITAESKGLQLAHCVARNLGHEYYAVARKSQKLYMQDFISCTVKSITTKAVQTFYLSRHDADLMKGKKVAIIDDVISTGGSLDGLEVLVKQSGGTVYKKAFVLAEGDASLRRDVEYLAQIPLL